MKKFLCYDTNDAASGKINVDSRGVLKPNSTVPSGGVPYDQLWIDPDGSTMWANVVLPVQFAVTNTGSSTTIQCNFAYDELRRRLNSHGFITMGCQLYDYSTKNLYTMTTCEQKAMWLEFSFVVPRDVSNGTMIGSILKVYYLHNGTITFTKPEV